MNDLRQCAQDVVDAYDSVTVDTAVGFDAHIEALRAALAETTEAVALAKQFHETYERLAPSFGYETRPDTRVFNPYSANGKLMIAVCQEIYTAPPSVDALIAEAIAKHDDELAIAKTVNTRKLAQPYLDALIADIDGLDETYSDTSPSMPAYMKSDVQFVMNKYRARGGA